jgi:hypothetical protein
MPLSDTEVRIFGLLLVTILVVYLTWPPPR